ncbi:MAG: nucleotide exchange factor GrpE [Acidobacteria bacterium]|nr:MAG: nucleotide exchange factor GrpE [Acidobacteriota bacterium]
MSPKKKIETEGAEGWEGVAEEAAAGALAPNPELEAALKEAEASLEAREKATAAPEGSGDELAVQLKETEDRLLRLLADFENFKRRALKERTDANQYGHQNLVKDLLSTVDNLDRAIDHARESEGEDFENLLQGVELMQRELMTALGKHGVVRIEAVGKAFDPAVHEAMAQAPDGSVAPNTVIEELQTGYMLRDRLLRPTRVIVTRAPDEAEGDEGKQPEEDDASGDGGGSGE